MFKTLYGSLFKNFLNINNYKLLKIFFGFL